MQRDDKRQKRRYDASRRRAAAAQRRLAVVAAAREAFEQRGWAGVTVREIAEASGVSHKTIEAVFGTKAALLKATVDYVIRGDVEPLPIVRRESVQLMEQARDAAEMLRLHARHLRVINARSARIAAVVEQAAGSDPAVSALWQQMNDNRAYGVRWATQTLLRKPGRRPRLRRDHVESIFWVALDWGTYRTLTEHAGLDDDAYERWLRGYYAATLLP
ncbi:MAG TPA: helix-turn-helix domain-containing protein [Gaiellaceae bacterium]|nr:helix-turn-helix domain-containing protein [Gaiellaceae bacterium]